MNASKKNILFFIRAYNDLDIQLSLITNFAADPRFKVRVMFYHADGFITHVRAHEAIDYVEKEYGVTFDSVLDIPACPFWLRTLYKIKRWAFAGRAKQTAVPAALFYKLIDAGIGKLIKPVLSKDDLPWLRKAAQDWHADIVFCDEILFQKGRSPVADHIIPALIAKGAVSYTALTGHRVYKDINPTGKDAPDIYNPSKAKFYFVPSEHNKKIYSELFPRETIEVSGNLRMDRKWIDELHSKVFPSPPTLPDKPVKIALMLSKMSYGVEADKMKETIRRLGQMENVALAIKPHTRAMKFDFMDQHEIGHAVIADNIPSASLIEWADIVLMTGSSIVFHAMIRGKVAGFLKYCQNLETIFDDSRCCRNFENIDDLTEFVSGAVVEGFPSLSAEQLESMNSFITNEIHGGVADGMTAQYCKQLILDDLGYGREEKKALQR